jgi:methanogenic corrinoid protein MtbC1
MTNIEEHLENIRRAIIKGDDKSSPQACSEALKDGLDPLTILNDGLMAGADVVGKKFEKGEYFLPQLMLAGRALKAAMAVVEPVLKAHYATSGTTGETGVVVIATVQTDIHDIGKNIVSSMLTASGFEVHDLGCGRADQEHHCQSTGGRREHHRLFCPTDHFDAVHARPDQPARGNGRAPPV